MKSSQVAWTVSSILAAALVAVGVLLASVVIDEVIELGHRVEALERRELSSDWRPGPGY